MIQVNPSVHSLYSSHDLGEPPISLVLLIPWSRWSLPFIPSTRLIIQVQPSIFSLCPSQVNIQELELVIQLKLSTQSLCSVQINIKEYRPCSSKLFFLVPSWPSKLWREYWSTYGSTRKTCSKFMNSSAGTASFYYQYGATGSCGRVNSVSNGLRHSVILELQDFPLVKSHRRFELESIELFQPSSFVFSYLVCILGIWGSLKPTLWIFELSPGVSKLTGVNRPGFGPDRCYIQRLAAEPIS